MKSVRKNGFKGIAVAAALSMTMTTMVSPAATAIPTGRWETVYANWSMEI